MVTPVPSWSLRLPSDLAALAVVAWFYASGDVVGRYLAPALTCSKKCLENETAAVSESPEGLLVAAE
jgi:hypothetical protein